MSQSGKSVKRVLQESQDILDELNLSVDAVLPDYIAVARMILRKRGEFARQKAYEDVKKASELEPLLREACRLIAPTGQFETSAYGGLASDELRNWWRENVLNEEEQTNADE